MASDHLAQREQLVKVTGIEDFFAVKSGGDTEAEATLAYDGGRKKPSKLGGPPVTGAVTVSRPYKRSRDAAILRRLRPLVGSWRTTVTISDTDRDLVATDEDPTVYTDALLMRVGEKEADASSGEPSTFELVFDPDDVT